jgi:hypothetical protein
MIQPGETGTIRLSVKIYPEWAGQKFTKGAVAIINDPAMPRFTLRLTGKVGQPEARPPVKKPRAVTPSQ